jgi:4-hydroxybenzoate polyprenyltransferase
MKGGYVLRVFSLLSIDVALGAAVSAGVAMRLTGAPMDWKILVAMLLTVWIIYAADHLMDIWKLVAPASSERHLFFQRHATMLTRIMAVILFVDGVFVLWLPARVVVAGFVVGIIALVYLLIQHRLNWGKEISGALLFTAGVWLPAISLRPSIIHVVDYFAIVIFFLTAFLNLLLFSRRDELEDRADRRVSVATQFGRARLDIIIRVVWALQFCVCMVGWYNFRATGVLWVLFAMNALLLMVDIFEPILNRRQIYRVAADAIFWAPSMVFLILVR